MKLYSPSELTESSGDMVLLYGESGVGKSVTAIQTAPDPIVYLMCEGRDCLKMLSASKRPDVKIKFGMYETFDDLMEMVSDVGNFEGANTIVVDSLTHIMSICLSDEILDESYEAMSAKEKLGGKELTMRVKMSQEGYGTLSGQMLRLTAALTRLSQSGKEVICIARVEQSPKWNRSLSAAPALKGKEYSKYFTGFFDFIGLLEPNIKDGQVVYPPLVSFQNDGSYVSKWTGLMPEGGVYQKVLDIEKILDIAKGK